MDPTLIVLLKHI